MTAPTAEQRAAGERLRVLRHQAGLKLREVENRTRGLITFDGLRKVEEGRAQLTKQQGDILAALYLRQLGRAPRVAPSLRPPKSSVQNRPLSERGFVFSLGLTAPSIAWSLT